MKAVGILLLLAVGAYSQSCAGQCGIRDDSKPCNCNSSCEKFGDCCSDYVAICKSCKDRCGEAFLQSKPCQCNDKCSSHGSCCTDYDDLCGGGGGGGATDAELRELTEALLAVDDNNVGSQITIDHQGQGSHGDLASGPYFTDVPASALSGPTIAALINLLDNYIPNVNAAEVEEPVEVEEIETFLNAIMATEVMAMTESFLLEKEIFTGSLRDKIKDMWFDFYARGSGALGSSGFEHSFVGEIKNNEVSGLHNWVQFYTEEQAGNLNYEGWTKFINLGDKGEVLENHLEWLGYPKAFGGMFTGTSPELDLAVYTVCFLARPDFVCPVQMNGVKFEVQTWTWKSSGQVGSAYPMI